MNLLVLMTTHNRESQVVLSLESLALAASKAKVTTAVFLANSGDNQLSWDHLDDRIEVKQFRVEPSTYWAQGMRLAWELSLEDGGTYDYVLWLNDDVILDPEAIETLLGLLIKRERKVIAVGSCRSNDGSVSYGGLRRSSHFLPLHFERMREISKVSEADTINGNVVLSSFWAHSQLGGFPSGYTHLRADIDFGLTAKKSGYLNLVTESPIATCDRSSTYKSYRSLKGMSFADKLYEINRPKFGPIREHVRLSMKHGGWLGPIYAVAPIIRAFIAK